MQNIIALWILISLGLSGVAGIITILFEDWKFFILFELGTLFAALLLHSI